jgi:hypothetical protein
MRRMLFGLMSVAALLATTPAWSQDVTVNPGRGGVDVGPRHDNGWRDRDTVGVGPRQNCHTVRQRVETPTGRVIYSSRRECR